MRSNLKKLNGKRIQVVSEVERFGIKHAFRGLDLRTILLKNVADAVTGEFLADHLWMTCGKWSQFLRVGEKIVFCGTVNKYTKGYKGGQWEIMLECPIVEDYRLSRPTNVRVLNDDDI